MNRLAMLLCFIGIAGCAKIGRTPENYQAPSTGNLRAQVSAASGSVQSGKTNIAKARTAIGQAQEVAREIEMAVSVDLRPQVEALKFRLSEADVELRKANDRADEALDALVKSENATSLLQVEIERQAKTLNATAKEKNKALDLRDKAEVRAKHQEGLAWKWRKHAAGAYGALLLGVLWFFKTPILRLFGVPLP